MFKNNFVAQCTAYNLHNIIFLHKKQNYFEEFLGLQRFEIFLKKFVLSYKNIHTFSVVCVLVRTKITILIMK